MICVYYTPTDTGGEDISNTDNKVFSHIDSVGFLRFVSMIKERIVKKRTAVINTTIRFRLPTVSDRCSNLFVKTFL